MFRRLSLTPFSGFAALVVFVASLYGAALSIVVFTMDWALWVPLLAATILPLVLHATRNPRLFFLVGMVFTAPFGLAINLWGHTHMGGAHALSINLTDFFMLPLLVFLARDFYLGYRRDLRFSMISLWWLALTALGVISVINGPFRQMATWEVVRMLKCWLLFMVIVNECVRERHFHYVVCALLANAAVNIVVAFIQFSIKRPLGLQPLGEASAISILGANLGVYVTAGDDVFRVTGLVGHANLFAAYLAMLLPLFVGQMFTGYDKSSKALFAIVSAGGLICLGLTLSRSGWVSFTVSCGLLMVALFALPELRKTHLALKVAMLVGGGVALFAGSGMIIRRLAMSDPGALDFRLEWVGIAWDMVREHPLFGLGLNSFIYQLADYAPYSIPKLYEMFGELFPVVHNTYMIIWSEQGTIGLLLFLGLHANILWIAIRNLRYRGLSDKIYLISIAAGCGVLAIMVDNLSSFFTKVQPHARVFWIVVGLVVAAHEWNVRNDALRRNALATPNPSPGVPAATPPAEAAQAR